MPAVERREPRGRLVRVPHPDEPARQPEQPPARLAPRPVRQVDARVAQHMHQTPLHRDVRPEPGRGRQTSAAPSHTSMPGLPTFRNSSRYAASFSRCICLMVCVPVYRGFVGRVIGEKLTM